MVTGYPGRTERSADGLARLHHDLDWYYPYVISYLAATATRSPRRTCKTPARRHQGDDVQAGPPERARKVSRASCRVPEEPRPARAEGRARREGRKLGRAAGPRAVQRRTSTSSRRSSPTQDAGPRATSTARRVPAARACSRTAVSFTRWAEERAKKDADRKPGLPGRATSRGRRRRRSSSPSRYDRALDRASSGSLARARAAAARGGAAVAGDAARQPSRGEDRRGRSSTRRSTRWYAAPLLEDEKMRLDLLTKGTMADSRRRRIRSSQAAQRVWPTVQGRGEEGRRPHRRAAPRRSRSTSRR